MKIFAYDGPLGQALDRLCSLLLLNLVFIVTSLPVVTLGVSVTAMYRCLLTMARGESAGILQLYFSAFKSNFRKAMLLSLCMLPFLAFAAGDAVLFVLDLQTGAGISSLALLLPLLLMLCILSFVFPLQAQFENTVLNTLKNAVMLAMGRLPLALLMIAVNLSVPFFAFFLPDLFLKTLPCWLFLGFSGPGMVNACLLRGVFARWMPEEPDPAQTLEEA